MLFFQLAQPLRFSAPESPVFLSPAIVICLMNPGRIHGRSSIEPFHAL